MWCYLPLFMLINKLWLCQIACHQINQWKYKHITYRCNFCHLCPYFPLKMLYVVENIQLRCCWRKLYNLYYIIYSVWWFMRNVHSEHDDDDISEWNVKGLFESNTNSIITQSAWQKNNHGEFMPSAAIWWMKHAYRCHHFMFNI